MHFFQKFKLGYYGEFYGAVDPMRIMSALKKFAEERAELMVQFEREQREKQPRLAEHTCDFVEWYNSLSEAEREALPPESVALVQKFIAKPDSEQE